MVERYCVVLYAYVLMDNHYHLRETLNLIPRGMISRLGRETRVEEKARTFSVTSHLAAMLFAQLTHAISLNDVCDWPRMKTTLNPVTLSGVLGTENPVVTRLKSGRYVAVFDTLKNQPRQGYGMDGYLIGYADSVDGVHWSAAKQLKVDCTKLWVTNIRTPLGLVEEADGTFTLFYTGFQRPAAGESSKGWGEYRNVGMLKVRLTVNKE
jgi:hypothetical protein